MIIYVLFRITAFFLATTIIFPTGTPQTFKVAFSLMLSVMIGINIEASVPIENFFDLIKYGVMETINGLILGYIVNVCFYSLKFAGKLIDNQMGLSMASTYDPSTNTQATIIENFTYLMGTMIFFAINAHHILIKAMQQSFNLIPVGYSILDNNIAYIVKVFVEYFMIGIKIAIPIIVVLIMTDLITGVISRSISGLNVMIVGIPLKMLVGLLFFMMALPFIINSLTDVLKTLQSILEGTLALSNEILCLRSVFL